MSNCRSLQIAVLVSAIFVATSAFRAEANVYPGSLATFTSGASNTKSLFTITGDTLTITGSPTDVNQWFVNTGSGAKQIVGIKSVYLVNANGTSPGATIQATSGYIAPSSTSPVSQHENWTVQTVTMNKAASFYVLDDGESGNGFGSSGKWLEVSTPSLGGKTATSSIQPFGSFTFSGPLLNTNGTAKYDLGLDVLFGGGSGSTGRVYFAMPSLKPVPEASTFVLFGILGLSMCLYVRRKKAAANVAA